MKRFMKMSFILSFFILGTVISYAQTVNGIPIEKYDVEYAQIIGTFGSVSFNVQLDFGHSHKAKDQRIIGKDGKQMEFKSMIEVLNFMTKYGYEYVDSYAGTGKQMGMAFYILRKKKE